MVTDPPYGISYCHGVRKGGIKEGTDGISIIGDDVPFDPEPFLKFGESLMWGAEHFKSRLPDGGRWIVWDKRPNGVVRDQSCCESAWCSNPGVSRCFRLMWDGFNKDSERGEIRFHSNQKPVSLMEWCLDFVVGRVIADPFMGSGSTGIACIRNERPFIGIEKDPKFFDIACKRIQKAWNLKCSELPFNEPIKPVQQAMFE